MLPFVCMLYHHYHTLGVIAHCYWSKVQCTNTDHTDSSYLLQSIVPGSDISSSDIFYSLVYLIYLLLLSGDVELNPGPITGKHTLKVAGPPLMIFTVLMIFINYS